jgi:hypothetical protein
LISLLFGKKKAKWYFFILGHIELIMC